MQSLRTGKTICYRCLQWERETAGSPHMRMHCSETTRLYPSARGRVPLGTSFRSRFKASETTFALPMLTNSALRAGRVPALLPFHSRLFRRTHHTTKQARRWCSLNINKAYLRAHHPRCDLCIPGSSPCIPLWVVSTSSLSPSLLESRNPDDDEDECTRNAEFMDRPTAASSDSSGFAEAERESLGVATCAALAPPHLVDRPTSALGPLEKDAAVHGSRLLHGGAEGSAVGSLGNPTPCTLRRSGGERFAAEPWHLVDGHPPPVGGAHCMVRILTDSGHCTSKAPA